MILFLPFDPNSVPHCLTIELLCALVSRSTNLFFPYFFKILLIHIKHLTFKKLLAVFLVRTELYLYISEIYALQPTHILNIYIIWLIFFIIREKPFLSLIIFTFSLKVYFVGFYYRHTNSFSLYTCILLLPKTLPTPFL